MWGCIIIFDNLKQKKHNKPEIKISAKGKQTAGKAKPKEL